MMLVRQAPVMTTLRTSGHRKREEEMGEGLEVSGLAQKTRVERGWIDLGFHQTARAGRRDLKKRCGLSVYEVGSSLKGIRQIREIKMGIMKECKAYFNEMRMTTFRDTLLLRCEGSSSVVSYAMK